MSGSFAPRGRRGCARPHAQSACACTLRTSPTTSGTAGWPFFPGRGTTFTMHVCKAQLPAIGRR
jgi:hypothetical protein